MNIQQLKVIVELAKGKSLIEIGEALDITQPTVSFHIRKLEEEIGVPMYVKGKKNLVLTKACYELVPYAIKILELIEEVKGHLSQFKHKEQPLLRISASHTPATYYLPSYIQAFKQQYPEVGVSFNVNETEKSIQLLKERYVDLAVVSLSHFVMEGLSIHPVTEDRFLLVYSPHNRLATLPEIKIHDLEREMFLLHEEGSTSRMVSNAWMEKATLRMSHVMQLSSIEMIREGVKYNLGIGILPENSIRYELESGQLHSMPLPHYDDRRCICLVYREENEMYEGLKAFLLLTIGKVN